MKMFNIEIFLDIWSQGGFHFYSGCKFLVLSVTSICPDVIFIKEGDFLIYLAWYTKERRNSISIILFNLLNFYSDIREDL
jgi:hypothetical protein